MSVEHQRYLSIVSAIIDRKRSQRTISPAWIATEAMLEIAEITIKSAPLCYSLSHLQLRQIARSQLRDKFESDDESGEKDSLFPDLQWRYPSAKSEKYSEPEYVLLSALTERDIDFNVSRLRTEAAAKTIHADALASWGRKRFGRLVG